MAGLTPAPSSELFEQLLSWLPQRHLNGKLGTMGRNPMAGTRRRSKGLGTVARDRGRVGEIMRSKCSIGNV